MGQPRTEWQTAKEPAKTIAYAAPEIFNNELPTTFSDVYSIAWAIIGLYICHHGGSITEVHLARVAHR